MTFQPADLARSGDLDALYNMMDASPGSTADRNAYKWLCCAGDFGHDVEELVSDLLEVSGLRYDDDGYQQAAAHWELACSYLLGTDGLSSDLGAARRHLGTAFAEFSLEEINEGAGENYASDAMLGQLSGPARTLLESVLAEGPARAVRVALQRVEQLREIGSVPMVMRHAAGAELARAVREFLGDDVEDGIFVS